MQQGKGKEKFCHFFSYQVLEYVTAGFDIHNYTPAFLDNKGMGHDALRLSYASGCREQNGNILRSGVWLHPHIYIGVY